jgi:hypothetical protein
MRSPIIAFVLCLAVYASAQRKPEAFPTPEQLMNPKFWGRNSSGSMTISFDETEQAIRVDVTFPPKVDKWIYPPFKLQKGMTLNGATAINFDFKILPMDDYKGLKCSHLHLKGFTPFEAAQPGTWKSFKIPVDKLDLGNALSFGIGLNPHNHKITYLMKNITIEGTPKPRVRRPEITTEAPGTVFFENQKIEVTSTRVLDNLAYELLDWKGNSIQKGNWPENGGKELVFENLTTGYYRIKTTNSTDIKLRDFTFAIVPDPKTRIYPHDSFYAIDAALSWVSRPGNFECPWYDGDTYRLSADLVAWAGIPHLRERLSWGETQAKQDEAPEYRYYLDNAKLCKERNMLISGMFHDAPAFSDRIVKLPSNLVAVFDYCKATGETFGNAMGNWEFWNEQDIGFAPDPVWDYAAALKAAYLGFKAANPTMPVTFGALCAGPDSSYAMQMFNNDAAKFSDFFNYHTYSPIAGYKRIYEGIRNMLDRCGRKDWAIWFTECGTNAEGHSTVDGVRKGAKAHSPEQEMILAEFYPKSQIEHQMQGCSRNYYFILGAYNERNGSKDWGIMRRDGSVKPSYAVASTMTKFLVNAKLQGEIAVNDKIKAYVFDKPDNSQVLCYWAISDLDTKGGGIDIENLYETTFEIDLPDGTYKTADMCGVPGTIVATNGKATIKANRFPAYIDGIKNLKATTPAIEQGKIIPYSPGQDEDLAVIIRADFAKEKLEITDRKSCLEMLGESARATIQVWNLDNRQKTGRLVVKGGTLEGLPETITLPPRGKAQFEVTYIPQYDHVNYEATLEIIGVFDGKSSSKFSVPIKLMGLFLKNCISKTLEIDKPENWRRNTSAQEYKCTFDEAENAIRFDVAWTEDVDKWFYPEHILKLPEESLVGAYAIEFEVKTAQNKVENDFAYTFLMAVEGTEREVGKGHHLTYPPPINEWEIRRVILPPDIDYTKIYMLRLGCNPKGTELTYWVRNARLLFPKGAK